MLTMKNGYKLKMVNNMTKVSIGIRKLLAELIGDVIFRLRRSWLMILKFFTKNIEYRYFRRLTPKVIWNEGRWTNGLRHFSSATPRSHFCVFIINALHKIFPEVSLCLGAVKRHKNYCVWRLLTKTANTNIESFSVTDDEWQNDTSKTT